MNGRFPKKITRRKFLSTSGKLTLGVTGILAVSTSLFAYGESNRRKRMGPKERPGNFIKLGALDRLTAMQGIEKIEYEATIQDAWVTKEMKGFVYVSNDADGNLLILSPICTHLGCTVEPVGEPDHGASSQDIVYRCPCHGAEFGSAGNATGNGKGLQGLATFKPIIADGEVYFNLLSPMAGNAASR
ncbi:Rieske 2Fe-2S domain-containing protein [Paenibacillus mesophilus]|uniref:QcrA and Rieske domain-containing protein n=1 Tax=Paenibacillus mesophilus TaxID=2582849 RepID=UPI00110D264D|nr:Rieske 2Fe-2S domain-containing protein [Paenibacillus mesophilus]TMV51567.1 Rieske 2Fe-2S domain-containing protein [Paenibacillus mesophilus]